MTQPPGTPDPSSPPQYGQQYGQQPAAEYDQQPAAEYDQQPAAEYGQTAQPAYGGQSDAYPSAPAPGYAPAQKRPGMVTAAAILAFVSGGLGVLGNLLAFTLIGDIGVPGFLVVLAVLGLLLSAGLIFGGIQAMQGKSFVILIALAGASILLNLITMIIYFQPTALLSFIIPILIIAFLMNPQSKAWIQARGGTTLG